LRKHRRVDFFKRAIEYYRNETVDVLCSDDAATTSTTRRTANSKEILTDYPNTDAEYYVVLTVECSRYGSVPTPSDFTLVSKSYRLPFEKKKTLQLEKVHTQTLKEKPCIVYRHMTTKSCLKKAGIRNKSKRERGRSVTFKTDN
jgi:hypothetical protein